VTTVTDIEAFRAEARAWLGANATPRSGDENPAALFTEHSDEVAYVAEAKAWQQRLFDAGWAGITWPEEYGGRGLSQVHQIVWVQESARYDLPLEIFSIGLGMGGPTVLTWGTPEQKERWLRPMLRGEEIWCQMFSEPNAGSDVAAVQTRAVPDGDEWVVNGQKVWTSGAHYSKWGMLLARTDPDVPKHKGLTYFVIDMEQEGVEARPLRQMTGGANFTEVFLSGARVPADGLIGTPGMGWSVAITTLMNERTSIGALGGIAGGSGTTAVERLVSSIADRTGVDPAADETVRDRLAQIAIRARVLGYHSERIIAALAKGEIPTAEGSIAKLALTDLLERVANFGVDVQGPFGMLGGDDALGQWETAFLGYPGMRIAGGSDEIMRNIIGERVLDLPGEPRSDRDLPFREVPKSG
jgi:alkylation response protein AidB-like acyl-CoA dehydrogenase